MIKRVAVINDLSSLGKCSLTAAIPVLSVMGVQPCPVPTAILTNQTEYDSYYCYDFTNKIDNYVEQWQKLGITFDGIYTGYLNSADQVKKILNFCDTFRKENTLLIVDPVMGDSGKVYDMYTPELGKKMRDLVMSADVITPNLTECCILTNTDYEELITHQDEPDYLDRIEKMARPLLTAGIKTIIITGIIHKTEFASEARYYNLVLAEHSCEYVSSSIYGGSYSGTGDLLASVVCGGLVNGDSPDVCVLRAVRFLREALIETVEEGSDRNHGINFEKYLPLLLK